MDEKKIQKLLSAKAERGKLSIKNERLKVRNFECCPAAINLRCAPSWFIIVIALLLMLAVAPVSLAQSGNTPASKHSSSIHSAPSGVRVDLGDRIGDINVVNRNGKTYVVVKNQNGADQRLTAQQYISAVQQEQESRNANRLFLVFNITTWAGVGWVALGLLGQILFTGRMVVQWLVSEKSQKSVVPVAFWWLSLGGASMLVIYFIWRKDIVGIIGQSAGWSIYARNLWLIHKKK